MDVTQPSPKTPVIPASAGIYRAFAEPPQDFFNAKILGLYQIPAITLHWSVTRAKCARIDRAIKTEYIRF